MIAFVQTAASDSLSSRASRSCSSMSSFSAARRLGSTPDAEGGCVFGSYSPRAAESRSR